MYRCDPFFSCSRAFKVEGRSDEDSTTSPLLSTFSTKRNYHCLGFTPLPGMSAEVKKAIQLEIAHVLFMDVVGFSKFLINDQTEILEQLNQLVRETPHFREAEAAGKLIRLSTGDGMALVFSNSPEAPVECALEISKALKMYPQIRLRMGVHSGPVNAVSDVNDRSNVTGAGINLAQRVMDCGDAGHILLSKHVTEDLEQYRQWQPHLHDVGEC